MKKTFQERMNMLNLEQKKAVETIDGPVMVVAGPGTGKTQILTLRIANILEKTDTEPEQILALTFTESGVSAMRKRLSEMIGSLAYRVKIYTFHSFANEVIQSNPEEFPTILGARSITDVDQIEHIERIIQEGSFSKLKPFGDTSYYVKSIKSKLSDLKREGVTVEEFKTIVEASEKEFTSNEERFHTKGAHAGKMKGVYLKEEKMIEKNKELCEIYEAYQDRLSDTKQYDFDDMIVEFLRALRSNQDLLLSLQEDHQYILVDEHQDTNNAQNKILELLAGFHDNPNLFVVGDEKQSIFRFQGASLENFFYFKHLYPQALLITLTQNYRSTQSILDGVHSLLSGKVILQANTDFASKPIHLCELRNQQQEMVWLSEVIEEKISEGIEPHEIAVLYRNNAHAFPIVDILNKKGIGCRVESDQNLFENKDARKFIQLMRVVAHPEDNEKLSRFLFSEISGLTPLVSTLLVRAGAQKRKQALIEIISDEKKLSQEGLSSAQAKEVVELAEKILSWKKYSESEAVVEVLEKIFRESGMLQNILASSNPSDKIETINLLFDQARSFASDKKESYLDDFLGYIDLLESHSISIKKKTSRTKEGVVRLMTAHRSKGLEFGCVFVVGVNDGIWGNKKTRELLPLIPKVYTLFDGVPTDTGFDMAEGSSDEERRLFYVALTRAKYEVYISFASESPEGKELTPSQFIGEIDESLVSWEDTTDFAHSWPEKQMVLFNESLAETVSLDEYKAQMKAFVVEKFNSQGLSVSALNNYLKSPWLYFFRSLVRIPSPMNKYLSFGNAVHGALQDFFDASSGEKYESKEFLLTSFKKHLDTQEVTQKDYKDLVDKGTESLSVWFEEYQGSWNLNTETEFRVNGVYLKDSEGLETIRLTGVLDKIEFQDSAKRNVVVVDYKTGKAKTEGQIRGTTKDSDGGYYRQLVFYKLLLNLYAEGKYQMQEGVLEFVEPDSKGVFRRYGFEIDESEVSELQETIRRVSDEIRNLSFWDDPVDENAEEYRDLVEALRR